LIGPVAALRHASSAIRSFPNIRVSGEISV
jgi:hypothetical protein